MWSPKLNQFWPMAHASVLYKKGQIQMLRHYLSPFPDSFPWIHVSISKKALADSSMFGLVFMVPFHVSGGVHQNGRRDIAGLVPPCAFTEPTWSGTPERAGDWEVTGHRWTVLQRPAPLGIRGWHWSGRLRHGDVSRNDVDGMFVLRCVYCRYVINI